MIIGRSHFVSRSFGLAFFLGVVLFAARSATAQDITSAPTSPPDEPLTLRAAAAEWSGAWIPIGPAPVDQAGAGRRGYVLRVEGADVTGAGANQFSVHTVAANNFYREQTSDFLVSQRYETHTLALDYRRGFKVRGLPRFEFGGQIQLHESDGGMLNGFIQGFESLWVSLTGDNQSKNELRNADATGPPPGTLISRNGSPLYHEVGTGSGVGDLYLTAKMALVDGDPSSRAARVAARIGINLATSSSFTEGNFFGAGLSLDKKLSESMAIHGDVRATLALDSVSVWGLPLKRVAYGFSVGPEFKLPKNSSFNLQIDGSSTPYLPTGALAFDQGYGDITLGLGHRFRAGSRHVAAQLYFRENMNLPFKVRWNTDPDLSVGIKATIY